MTVLEQLYASGGRQVILDTLQITIGDQTYYLTKGWDDITAKTEAGDTVTFTACGIDIALPARTADGFQDLTFAISNITGQVSGAIRAALAAKQVMTVTYRRYVSTDLAAPAERPAKMTVKQGQWTALQVQLTCGYMNILDTAWPRHRYTLNKHPGLRYF